ncbi:MAG: DUF3240 family protein [Pseudomonadota bacterium]
MNKTTETLAGNLTEKNPEKCLVTLYAPPALEETLVDFLLENDEIGGFSTTEAYGHGQRPSGMTLLEQVTGRQRRIQFMVETEQVYVATLLELLGKKFVGLHYMVTPLLAAGRL